MSREITRRLGRNPFVPDADRNIEVIVSRDGDLWRSRIFVRAASGDLEGQRDLKSGAAQCDAITEASVLAVALAIDPDALLSPAPPVAEPSPYVAPATAEPPNVPAPALPVVDRPKVERPISDDARSGRGAAVLRGGVAFGLLPRAAPGLSIAAEYAPTRLLSATWELLWLPEQKTEDGRFGFGLTAASLGACANLPTFRFAAPGVCAGLWAGALHATVYSLVPVEPGDWAWAAGSVTPRIRFRLGATALFETGLHLMIPLARHRFTVESWPEPVFRQSPLAAQVFGGLGVQFW